MICSKLSTKDFSLTNVSISKNELWSGYHKKYSPLNNDAKMITFKIINNNIVKVLVNTYDEYFDNTLDLNNILLVYRLK